MFTRSQILKSPHAFSDRCGGVSTLSHTHSLNLGFGRGDDNEIVLENFKIFADAVGFCPDDVVSVSQVHSDIVLEVGEADRGRGYDVRGTGEADGYITNVPNVVLGIKSADCVPVLFEGRDESGNIICIGAVHSGWRGTAQGIAVKCVQRMCQRYGVESKNIYAAIGPCIHAECFEVGRDVYDGISNGLGERYAERFILPHSDKDEKYFCDLPSIIREHLIFCGICEEHIDVLPDCTCCLPEKYFSHRYSGGVRGTMLNVIFMQDDKYQGKMLT